MEANESLRDTAKVMAQLGFSLFAHGDDEDKAALRKIFAGFSETLHAYVLTAGMAMFPHFCGDAHDVETAGDVPEHMHRMIHLASAIETVGTEAADFVVEMVESGQSLLDLEGFLFTIGGAVHAVTCNHGDDWSPESN